MASARMRTMNPRCRAAGARSKIDAGDRIGARTGDAAPPARGPRSAEFDLHQRASGEPALEAAAPAQGGHDLAEHAGPLVGVGHHAPAHPQIETADMQEEFGI